MRPTQAPRFEYGFAAAVLAVVTAVAFFPSRSGWVATADIAMLYLAGIVVTALRCGRPASVAAALASVATFDFFFVEPWYTFNVAQSHHLLTFVTMFVVGIALSGVAHRLREHDAERTTLAEAAREGALQQRTESMRSALLSAVSHDLRTPLATITGAATTLRDEGSRLAPTERLELLDAIASEAFRLERLVSSLLDMSRVEAGALVLRREWLPVEEVFGSALGRVEERLAPRPVSVRVAPQFPLLYVDPVMIEQVLVNLLENVARYTPPSSPVELSARVVDRVDGAAGSKVGPMVGPMAELVVADHGPGLPPGVPVFEKFVRGPAVGGDRSAGGVGLGLALCRGLITAHGGTITASTDNGCVMTIRLPLVSPPTVSPEVSP